jgi:hypothetical protein
MIYITNLSDNKITTESWLDYIPEDLLVYIDDVEIGTYLNESLFSEYITITIPSSDLINLQNKEYTLKLYHNLALLKVELVTVQSNIKPVIKTVTNNQKTIMYE